MTSVNRAAFTGTLIVVLALGGLPGTLQATTVARIASTELVSESELIFQGEVVHTESWRAANGRIFTWVDFNVVEVLKGETPGNGLRLRFSGGQVGDLGMSTGVPIPQAGEQGIYFVETTRHPLANPLYGWSQGHFVIDAANQVKAGNGELVTSVEAARKEDGATGISRGVAAGFRTVRPNGSELVPPRGLSPEEFKERIREMLQQSNRAVQ